jgi:hypothetical protein
VRRVAFPFAPFNIHGCGIQPINARTAFSWGVIKAKKGCIVRAGAHSVCTQTFGKHTHAAAGEQKSIFPLFVQTVHERRVLFGGSPDDMKILCLFAKTCFGCVSAPTGRSQPSVKSITKPPHAAIFFVSASAYFHFVQKEI